MKPHSILLCLALLVLASCNRSSTDDVLATEEIVRAMPKGGEVVDEKRGKELWLAVGAMGGVNEHPANGVALAHYFENGTYLLTVDLNIELPPDGFFYEGWLLDEGKDPVSAGHFRSVFGDVRHRLEFETDEDFRGSLNVIVTVEPDDGNPAPAEHVAEGTMVMR